MKPTLKLSEIILSALSVSIAFMLLMALFGNAMDRSLDNRDEMLCNSAKVSGNIEYLNKCQCFYNGESIRCINEK